VKPDDKTTMANIYIAIAIIMLGIGLILISK
jgi:hypothetical protein